MGESHLAWGWGWGRSEKWDPLDILLHLDAALGALFGSRAHHRLRLVPGFKVPAAVQEIWPFRPGRVGVLRFLGLFFLVV